MSDTIVALAADHAGYALKEEIRNDLERAGVRYLDLGTEGSESVDYPDFGMALAHAVAEGQASRGIVVCGTGIGVSIAANRVSGVRAAVCHDVTTARLARQHNDANVMALGARIIGGEVARDCVQAFLETEFDGGERHRRRVEKLG